MGAEGSARISDPALFRDRAEDWYNYYDSRRRLEILDILEKHPEIVEEHAANPTGYRRHHSPMLQRVLNYFRAQPALGKYFIYLNERWGDYRIAVNVELGKRPVILDEPAFTSEEEAMHAVFLKRIEDLRARGE